jgi:hypothetical protein
MKANPFQKYLTQEDNEHIRVVNYIKDKLPDVVAFHIPNESKKSPFERYKHSLMGALKGCPDFAFMFPKYKSLDSKEILYHGLFIELKAPEHSKVVLKGKDAGKLVKRKGKLSPEQKEVLDKLTNIGYYAVCCFGSEDAIKVINEYFAEYLELKKKLRLKEIFKNKID